MLDKNLKKYPTEMWTSLIAWNASLWSVSGLFAPLSFTKNKTRKFPYEFRSFETTTKQCWQGTYKKKRNSIRENANYTLWCLYKDRMNVKSLDPFISNGFRQSLYFPPLRENGILCACIYKNTLWTRHSLCAHTVRLNGFQRTKNHRCIYRPWQIGKLIHVIKNHS